LRKLQVGVIDLGTNGPTRALWSRVMHANLASIMPQVIAGWCEEAGHDVTFVCYTGLENLVDELPPSVDIVFIGAFTRSAQLSYALSNQFRAQGAITVLGGPHARCYPQDAQKYFDYVLGFTDKEIVETVLRDRSANRPMGVHLSAKRQPPWLPGVRARWKFIERTLEKAPFIKIVPMIGSLGCPYTCAFCIDASVPYQALDIEEIKADLRFLLTKYKRPHVGWHDPNFGVRFDDIVGAIEESVPPNSIDFIAESSLSLLNEAHVKRLAANGFKAMLPGIESWYDLGNKSKTGVNQGMAKVQQVADHINMVMRHIPYLQANFVLGLDCDAGDEPFELTKRFLDLAPGAFPGYSLLSAFGEAAPLNLEYQREGRVRPFPHHLLDNNHAINVVPKNYSWPEFYDHVIDVTKYSFDWPRIAKRFRAVDGQITRWMNVVRAVSDEGFGRIKYHGKVRNLLETDTQFRDYFEGRTTVLPTFFRDQIRKDLGPFWDWLPEGALEHDADAYLQSQSDPVTKGIRLPSPTPAPAPAT